jgi:retron-type reverse transcriptase
VGPADWKIEVLAQVRAYPQDYLFVTPVNPSEVWKTLPWKKFQRNVYRLQKRIYRARKRGDVRTVHNLQRLLLRSWSARFLAVRRVSQDNRGKRTAGVDGVASLTPSQRLNYARRLRNLDQAADPVRRTYLTKPDGGQRPLGIPTMLNRAYQALVKLALEPEWEAVFEPNSYGFRPGRSPHDAIEAVFNFIRLKPKFVLKADIEKCFDKIDHQALLDKLLTIQPITKLVRGWLKAGIVDQGQTLFPETGVPQGGVISPLLMNVALHGLEQDILKAYPNRHKAAVIRFADGEHYLFQYEQTKIRRHIKVIGSKSPFDGDWLYWAQRLQRHPLKPVRVIKLLKWQRDKCEDCGLPFTTEDVLEVHHINGNHSDNRYANLSLLHGHCHDIAHASGCC